MEERRMALPPAMEEPLKSGDGLSYNGCEYIVATESYLPMLEPLRSVLVLRFSESLEAVAPCRANSYLGSALSLSDIVHKHLH